MRDGHRPSQSERPRRRRHVLRRQSWGRRTFQDPCVTAGAIQFHPQASNVPVTTQNRPNPTPHQQRWQTKTPRQVRDLPRGYESGESM